MATDPSTRDGAEVARGLAVDPQFQDPLIYLLLVAIGISMAAWAAEGATGAPVDVLVFDVPEMNTPSPTAATAAGLAAFRRRLQGALETA